MSDNKIAEALLVSRLHKAEDYLKRDPELYNAYQRDNEQEGKSLCCCICICIIIVLALYFFFEFLPYY